PTFIDPDTLRARAAAEGFSFWHQLFLAKASWQNPDSPTLNAWKIRNPPPTQVITFERNPYYWKVDPRGNQLPYIERLTYEILAPELMNLRFLAGDMGFQHRHVSLENFALFMEH